MADILPFRKPERRKPSKGMCQHGFHKWVIWKEKQFDVKQGRLITIFRCERCGAEKVSAI